MGKKPWPKNLANTQGWHFPRSPRPATPARGFFSKKSPRGDFAGIFFFEKSLRGDFRSPAPPHSNLRGEAGIL